LPAWINIEDLENCEEEMHLLSTSLNKWLGWT